MICAFCEGLIRHRLNRRRKYCGSRCRSAFHALRYVSCRPSRSGEVLDLDPERLING